MAVTLVARVNLTNMDTTFLYPKDGRNEERIALLTGIVQLVSAALDRSGNSDTAVGAPNYMKSERGVIGYCKQGKGVIIVEGDTEPETADALKAVLGSGDDSDIEIQANIEKSVHKRGKEIGDLWK
ncbi:MAG: hypothetical protein ACXAEF_09045 [Candidatus Thorarchaeota archaeon]|jgi:hypothetical protein